jgi:predicted AAA+ superfamily ATPase
MQRNQLINLEQWHNDAYRKPLLIRGARQVGKSTLVRLFAELHSLALAEVNLEQYSRLNISFASLQPRQILNDIEALPGMKPIGPGTLLFLDEIQAAPSAIPALRYFYEQMSDLALVSAGSLLEFALADHSFSMPVGRIQYLHMGPMTFTEYLEALEEHKLKQVIQSYAPGRDIGPLAHQRLLELLRSYYFVGGMPEAVATFARNHKYSDVNPIHNSIIETYREDFPKYAGSRNLTRLLHVFNFAARNVGVKVKYSNISKDDQSATIRKDIDLLCMARVISKVVHTHASGLPLQGDLEESVYKLLFLDVGLMNAVSGLGWNALSGLNEMQLINEGKNAEQFIGQHLQALMADSPNRELTYWLREGKSANAEVDFVVAFDGRIVPVEVKAGTRGSLRSLHQFAGEKSAALAVRFDSNPPSKQTVTTTVMKGGRSIDVKYDLLSLPLYLVERLPELIAFGSPASL